jgi:hypothetical protein
VRTRNPTNRPTLILEIAHFIIYPLCWIHGKSVYLNIIQQQISVSKARWRRVPNTRKK